MCVMSQGLGDVGLAGEADEADSGRALRGHDSGAVAGADLGWVLIEGEVSGSAQAVLDAPVSLDPGDDLIG